MRPMILDCDKIFNHVLGTYDRIAPQLLAPEFEETVKLRRPITVKPADRKFEAALGQRLVRARQGQKASFSSFQDVIGLARPELGKFFSTWEYHAIITGVTFPRTVYSSSSAYAADLRKVFVNSARHAIQEGRKQGPQHALTGWLEVAGLQCAATELRLEIEWPDNAPLKRKLHLD